MKRSDVRKLVAQTLCDVSAELNGMEIWPDSTEEYRVVADAVNSVMDQIKRALAKVSDALLTSKTEPLRHLFLGGTQCARCLQLKGKSAVPGACPGHRFRSGTRDQSAIARKREAAMTPEQRSERSRRGHATRIIRKTVRGLLNPTPIKRKR